MHYLRYFYVLLLTSLFSACGNSSTSDADGKNSEANTSAAESPKNQTSAKQPIEVVGSTTADVSTWQTFIAALAPAFISGDKNEIAAVAYPNTDMMKAFILQHYGAANAQAEIELLDTKMPINLNKVLNSIMAARKAAADAGADFSNATFESSERVSGLSIGGMKVNTLGMNIKSGDKVYTFEFGECRDILNRWVTMGEAKFMGVSSGAAVQEDGSLDLGL